MTVTFSQPLSVYVDPLVDSILSVCIITAALLSYP
jgi:hypothetical protein